MFTAAFRWLPLRRRVGHTLSCQWVRNISGPGQREVDKSSNPFKGYPKGLEPPTMDEMAVPSGDWQESYQRYQKKYNRQLFAGMAFLVGTVVYIYKTNAIDLVLSPPTVNKDTKQKPWYSRFMSRDKKKGSSLGSTALRPLIDYLPESASYLIVGGGAASFSAFRAIRTIEPKAKVIVITDEDHYPYMRPPLSKELWSSDSDLVKRLAFKQWSGKERSVFFENEQFYCSLKELADKETGGVSVIRGHRVVKLDPKDQKAFLDSGQVISYEKCLLATGGKPRNLEVFEKAAPEVKKKVVLFRKVNDFLTLEEASRKAKSVTIIGGGFLGSELACALGRRAQGSKSRQVVNQVFPEPSNIWKVVPEYLSQWTTERVREEGVNVISGVQVSSVASEGGRVSLQLSNGESILTDYVLVAVGLDADVELAKTSGLETHPSEGGFLVNAELEARTNLWVAGDASCFFDVKLGRRRIEHHDHAVVSGRLAGENMTGAKKHYWHQSMFWSDLGPNVGFEAIGIVDSSLPTVGVFAKATESDTPKAIVEATGGGLRSETEQHAVVPDSKTSSPSKEGAEMPIRAPRQGDDYGKGVVFYLRDKVVVGIVLWNVFNRMPVARRVINEGKPYDDLNEVAKLFAIHSEEE